jgi:hypothetical protein
MPEIWLPYGPLDVSIDIKAENLSGVFSPVYPEAKPLNFIDDMKEVGAGSILVVVCDTGPHIIEVVKYLLDELPKKGLNLLDTTITAPKGLLGGLRKVSDNFPVRMVPMGPPSLDVGIADDVAVRVPTVFSESKSKIIISEVGFDSLFGFRGGPVSLLKVLDDVLIKEAFLRRSGDIPLPGEETNSGRFASRMAEKIGDLLSIEVIPSGDKIAAVSTGAVLDAHVSATQSLIKSGKKLLGDPAKVIVASPGGGRYDMSLASSLKSLINLKSGMKERGGIALIAECSEGLGSKALQLYVSGRLNIGEAVKRGEYVEGLEDILFLKGLLNEHTITLVSTLPNYYVESKLGLHAHVKSSDALTYLLSSYGSRAKICIIPRAAETLLSAGSEEPT